MGKEKRQLKREIIKDTIWISQGGTPNRYLREKGRLSYTFIWTGLLAVFLWVVYPGYCSEFIHRWSYKKMITWKNELKVIAKSPTWKIYNNSVSLYLFEISKKIKAKISTIIHINTCMVNKRERERWETQKRQREIEPEAGSPLKVDGQPRCNE